jgi:hypothetical protein
LIFAFYAVAYASKSAYNFFIFSSSYAINFAKSSFALLTAVVF